MNSLEMISGQPNHIESIYKAIHQRVSTMAGEGVEVAMLEPRMIEKENPYDVPLLGLLRLGTQKGRAVYGLGYSGEFLATWNELFPAPAPDAANAGTPAKSKEFEMLRAYFLAVEQCLKIEGLAIDPKQVIFQEPANLGGWGRMAVTRSVQLPINVRGKELVFEIPFFGVEEARTKTQEVYGFKENARILVVDDSGVSRKQSIYFLAMAGYHTVDECQDGKSAYSRILSSTPPIDLVVADWHMPVMSGLELLKKVRATAEVKKMPFILVTGEQNKDEVMNAIREGVTSYIVKPIMADSFFKALTKAGNLVRV